MNIGNPFQQLMERRLWPIALLLVAAIVAAPMLLKKDAGETYTPTPVTAGPTGASPEASVVTLADSGRTDRVRSVLGSRKDPFRPAEIVRIPKAETEDTGSAEDAAKDVALDEIAGGGGVEAPEATDPVDLPDTGEPEAPQPTFELFSLVASFGDASGTQERKVIERLTGLPGGNPSILYLGLLKDHETAVFIVNDGVEVTGDGKCNPSPEDCRSLTLKAGETQFFTRGDITYQLDLEKVVTRKVVGEKAITAARKKVAKGGKKALAKSRSNPFKYSDETGVVSARVSRKFSSRTEPKKGFVGGALDSTG